MKKDAVIDIISNDLKEIELLLENFRGEGNIQPAFIELLKSKHQNIGKEIALLDFWSDYGAVVNTPVVEAPKPSPLTEMHKVDLPPVTDQSIPVCKDEAPAEQPPLPEIITTAQTATPAAEEQNSKTVLSQSTQPLPPVAEAPKANPVPANPAPVQAKPSKTTKASDITNYGTPVTDIRKAISIGDRFNYQKELFSNNADDMNNAITIANDKATYDEAESYLLAHYGWDPENKTVVNFLKAVHRRFI